MKSIKYLYAKVIGWQFFVILALVISNIIMLPENQNPPIQLTPSSLFKMLFFLGLICVGMMVIGYIFSNYYFLLAVSVGATALIFSLTINYMFSFLDGNILGFVLLLTMIVITLITTGLIIAHYYQNEADIYKFNKKIFYILSSSYFIISSTVLLGINFHWW